MTTNFKTDNQGLAGFDVEIKEDITVKVNLRENTVTLLYGEIVKEQRYCDSFTLTTFGRYIDNLCNKFEIK